MAALPELLKEMQVLHVSGTRDWPQVEQARAALTAEQAARYRVYPYLHTEMGAAYRAADLALTRAGASTLGEFPYFGLPSILVPYPHAWRYQRVNAQYLAQRGAAEILEDADLPQQIAPTVLRLMSDAPRRAQMSQAMHSLAQPQASAKIADLLANLAGQTMGGRV
jgi:UDP-N-acetylglucosamine--N-acetylmuramyl-(pentapeptide) pyrophosphoryl-undecaprenol N-acetylglucosamine transferase